MDYLFIDPNTLIKRIDINSTYQFKFLKILEDYIPIEFYNKYLSYISEYKLKNIWNHIVIKWNTMRSLVTKKTYIESDYPQQKYNQIHEIINEDRLNELIEDFISGDIFKAFFAVNCIQNHFIEI